MNDDTRQLLEERINDLNRVIEELEDNIAVWSSWIRQTVEEIASMEAKRDSLTEDFSTLTDVAASKAEPRLEEGK